MVVAKLGVNPYRTDRDQLAIGMVTGIRDELEADGDSYPRVVKSADTHSTVTLLAKFRGLSISQPRATAM